MLADGPTNRLFRDIVVPFQFTLYYVDHLVWQLLYPLSAQVDGETGFEGADAFRRLCLVLMGDSHGLADQSDNLVGGQRRRG